VIVHVERVLAVLNGAAIAVVIGDRTADSTPDAKHRRFNRCRKCRLRSPLRNTVSIFSPGKSG
jgi:hypothetical protein